MDDVLKMVLTIFLVFSLLIGFLLGLGLAEKLKDKIAMYECGDHLLKGKDAGYMKLGYDDTEKEVFVYFLTNFTEVYPKSCHGSWCDAEFVGVTLDPSLCNRVW